MSVSTSPSTTPPFHSLRALLNDAERRELTREIEQRDLCGPGAGVVESQIILDLIKRRPRQPGTPTPSFVARMDALETLLTRLYLAVDSGSLRLAENARTFSDAEMRTLEYFVGGDGVLSELARTLPAAQHPASA